MIGWLNPAALWALPLVAAPVLIHLLRTHHPTRVAFPSLRFVPPSRMAAVRMRLPSDVALLLVRVAIVALAVVALAGPIALTAGRIASWNSRIARAVVVDRSDSMGVPDGTGVAPERAAADSAAAELASATYGVRLDARDLHKGMARASAWLAMSPPARREIVVVSDFQRGGLTSSTISSMAGDVGVRFVPVGRRAEASSFEGARLLGASDVAARELTIETTVDTTAVALRSSVSGESPGLRLIGPPGTERDLTRLWRVLAVAGTFASAADQPITVQLAGAPLQATPVPISPGWMVGTVLRLQNDPALSASSGSTVQSGAAAAASPWTTLALNPRGETLVRAAASGAELLVDVKAPVDSLFAAEVVRAVLNARIDPRAYDEREVARVDEALLVALSRPPGPVTLEAWRASEASDARWAWLAVLTLLGVEQWLRGRSVRARAHEGTRAAA
jgi:hypothetical protein